MNDQVSIVRGPLDSAKRRLRKWQDMLDHAHYHPWPAQTGAVGECLRKGIRAAFNRFELQSVELAEWRER
jgi:hypothetical protein